jgi:hypothetical protein
MPRREVAAEVAVLIVYFVVGVASRGIEQLKTRLRRA